MSYTDRFRVDARPQVPAGTSGSRGVSAARLISMIERACNPTLMEPNLALNLEIVDLINQKKGSFPREAAVAIVKLINSRTPQTSILALGLLDVCVKNCGYPFHLQISRKEFLNELVRKFPEKPPMSYTRTQQLILEAIEEWNQTLCKTSRYRDDLGYVRDMHRLLSYKGYIFPEINRDDAAVLNPTETLKSAHELEEEEREAQSAKLQELIRRATPADLQEANRLMGIMAGLRESKTDYHAKAAKELDKVRRKAEILEEMLQNHQGEVNSDDVFSDIVAALRNTRPKIQRMIQEEKDDHEATVKLIALNDYINSLVDKYDKLRNGDSAGASAVKIMRPEGASAPKTDTTKQQLIDNLIDLDQDEPSPAQQSGSSSQTQTSSQEPQPENLIDALDGLSFGNIALGSPASHSPAPSASPAVPSPAPAPATPSPQPQVQPQVQPADEWTFSSAVPSAMPSATPTAKQLSVLDSELAINFSLSKAPLAGINIDAFYSNKSSSPISGVSFQLAVPKGFSLQMKPQSGTDLAPNTPSGITQSIHIDPSAPSKLRWKVNYTVGGVAKSQEGLLDNIEL
uniref:ARAD1C14498p n=1 Tax=Blastobotrys adeninivorans TaxID=409370 RepID=A0A060T5R1_BLAAD